MGDSDLTPEAVQEQMLECRQEMNNRLAAGDATMSELKKDVRKALEMLAELETAMESILAIYKIGEGWVKVTIVIGKIIKWAAAVGAAIAAIMAFLHFGGPPK